MGGGYGIEFQQRVTGVGRFRGWGWWRGARLRVAGAAPTWPRQEPLHPKHGQLTGNRPLESRDMCHVTHGGN